MTKVKLIDGSFVDAISVKLENGILKISVLDYTVEELASMFSDKRNTSLITLMTESEIETGIQTGFTSFAGIDYDSEGVKTVKLFQPVDATESRISNAEGTANQAIAETEELGAAVDALLGIGGEI